MAGTLKNHACIPEKKFKTRNNSNRYENLTLEMNFVVISVLKMNTFVIYLVEIKMSLISILEMIIVVIFKPLLSERGF